MAILSVKSKRMSFSQLKAKAEKLGVNPGRMEKTELIHSIQKAEGFTPCFGTTNGSCPQEACCFRDDCLTLKK
jgi:hypothetical protein